MKKVNVLIAVFMGMFAVSSIAYAALSAVDVSPGADDVREINNMTPGSSKTFLGTRLGGRLITGSTTYAAAENGNPLSTVFATPTTTVFYKTTGTASAGGESYRLGDGTYGQELTVVLVTDGGANFTITPKTKTGFTSIQLDDAKDSATLKWSGTEWFIKGNNGATIN